MTERANRLLAVMSDRPLYDMSLTERMHVARAICEHLALGWDSVHVLRQVALEEVDASFGIDILPVANAIRTLLEAAGTPEPTEGE